MSTVFTDEKSGLEYLYKNNQSKKLICFMHGYGASMHDLYPLHEFIENHSQYDWVFLNAPLKISLGLMMEGRAWFPIDMQALEQAMAQGSFRSFSEAYPAELASSIETVLSFLKEKLPQYNELHLGGFSQGAMLSSHLAFRGVEKLKSVTLFSGNLIGEGEIEKRELSTPNLDIFQSHGHGDQVLDYAQAKTLFELLKLKGARSEFVSFKGGHEIPLEVMAKWNQFMSKF